MDQPAVLFLNLGSLDSPSVPDVRRYLSEFLMDGRVLDAPTAIRWMIVNLRILPTRAKASAKLYEKIWGEDGSPLLHDLVGCFDEGRFIARHGVVRI